MCVQLANLLGNSRILDILHEINECPQIPADKRFDLSIDISDDEEDGLYLDIDRPSTPPPGYIPPQKSYKQLLREVPHFRYAEAAERLPNVLADLEAGRDSPADPQQGQSHPPSFLTADDIDNYTYEVDLRNQDRDIAQGLAPKPLVPTLAPLAHKDNSSNQTISVNNRDFALRNPTSVYNWLRKHAPKTFLQDGEHGDKDKDAGGDDSHHATPASGRRGGRGEGGSGRGSRGGRAVGEGSTRSKRKSVAMAAAAAAASSAADEYDDDMMGYGAASHNNGGETPSGAKGKRKRVVDDDPGYRPKGGSSRPTKKKRQSQGTDVTSTPSAAPSKRPRKSGGGSYDD